MCGGLLWSIQRRNLPCNAENNPCARYIVIEARFTATEGVLDCGVLGWPTYVTWDGLVGREDTR